MNPRVNLRAILITSLAFGIALPGSILASGHGAPKKSGHGDAKKSGHGDAKKKGGHGASAHSEKPKEKESPASAHAADVEKILSMIAGKERKHDPRLYKEVDLGEFRVTRPGQQEEDILVVKFHIYGVLHEQDELKFTESTVGRQQRLRDAVLSVVHRSEFEQLLDPSLEAVKDDLSTAINRVLENDFIRDVAFSDFAMERD
jgi:hypothetical protein